MSKEKNANEEDDLVGALDNLIVKDDEAASQTSQSTTEAASNRKSSRSDETPEPEPPSRSHPNLNKIADWLESVDHILVLTGAGVSVSAGIPDFRTPGTGLYDNLAKYNLPYAEAVFDIDYYRNQQAPFVQLASELWPSASALDAPQPTLTHTFVALLHDKGKLLRNYSQNIDGLEHMANIPEEKLVECHGHFRSARCISCNAVADVSAVRDCIVQDQATPRCKRCDSPVKPDIVFFGEQLPPRFHEMLPGDAKKADLCLVLGTSLNVPPVAHIPNMVRCRRVLLNRESVGGIDAAGRGKNPNDAFLPGDCDDSVMALAERLGWAVELKAKHEQSRLELKIARKEAATKAEKRK